VRGSVGIFAHNRVHSNHRGHDTIFECEDLRWLTYRQRQGSIQPPRLFQVHIAYLHDRERDRERNDAATQNMASSDDDDEYREVQQRLLEYLHQARRRGRAVPELDERNSVADVLASAVSIKHRCSTDQLLELIDLKAKLMDAYVHRCTAWPTTVAEELKKWGRSGELAQRLISGPVHPQLTALEQTGARVADRLLVDLAAILDHDCQVHTIVQKYLGTYPGGLALDYARHRDRQQDHERTAGLITGVLVHTLLASTTLDAFDQCWARWLNTLLTRVPS